jgi:PIN domain nuclease of toxin-antitoxin system
MRALLDTQCWLWLVGDPARLSSRARRLLQDPANELLFSAASAWEIAIKHAIGKLELPDDPAEVIPEWMVRSAVTPLPVLHSHALHVASLPLYHADPFDRLLIAQAQLEDVPVLTADAAFRDYEVEVIAA